tara:strand:+ start:483 stop:1631 length:1149 start_codon:yes stop_codon:yes gene_type:complete
MKFTELFEDYANDWLTKYTHENLDKWPGPEVIKKLSKRYPVDSNMVIYRGLNFRTEEEWDEFVANMKAGENVVQFGGISSWSPDEGGAKTFAVTRPSYFLSAELMAAETIRSREMEYISGYRGIIIKTNVTTDMGAIDVTKSSAAHENEIILPAGSYKIGVHKVIKRFKDEVADTGVTETVSKILDQMLDLRNAGKSDEYITKFYKYIRHHFSDKIIASEKFKEKVFGIVMGKAKWKAKNLKDIVSVSTMKSPFDEDDIEVRIHFNRGVFDLAEKGMAPASQMPMIKKYADIILKAYKKAVKENSATPATFKFGALESLRPYVSDPSAITILMQQAIGNKYQKTNSRDAVADINKIKDPDAKRRAIEKHQEDIMRILGQFKD